MEDLLERFLAGDRRALAKAISLVENNYPNKRELLQKIYPYTGKSYVVGVTGSPGAGKSSLIKALTKHLRHKGMKIGIIAVDPTSPFSGGAILGDRVRMQDRSLDEGVFMRSLASRGSLGGLTVNSKEILSVMDAFGQDVIFIETVGVGQSEVDIMKVAHTTLVVLTPAGGDSIQAIKAGIMEIADVFAINKADLPGADKTYMEVDGMLEMKHGRQGSWRPPIIKTVTTFDEGVAALWQAIEQHRSFLETTGKMETIKHDRLRQDVLTFIEERIKDMVLERVEARGNLEAELARVAAKEIDPYTVAEKILASTFAPVQNSQ